MRNTQAHMDLITNEVNSASFGATLLAHLTASFEQNVLGVPLPTAEGDGPRLVQAPDNQFLYYAAHDINLLYVRHLLRYVRCRLHDCTTRRSADDMDWCL